MPAPSLDRDPPTMTEMSRLSFPLSAISAFTQRQRHIPAQIFLNRQSAAQVDMMLYNWRNVGSKSEVKVSRHFVAALVASTSFGFVKLPYLNLV
jgi:hypothetical protein